MVVSDNRPQFRSQEYLEFSNNYNFIPIYSSPQFPKSNGQAERYVQTIKDIIKKCNIQNKDIELALLNYRNTPLPVSNASPAQLLMSPNPPTTTTKTTSSIKQNTRVPTNISKTKIISRQKSR